MTKKHESVELFMERLDHPLKAEVEALRAIIKGVHPAVMEEIKWNAPSYRYTDYICTFNLRATQHVHLIFHNPAIASVPSEMLSGDYVDRRMAYFTDMDDVREKQPELERIVAALIRLMEG